MVSLAFVQLPRRRPRLTASGALRFLRVHRQHVGEGHLLRLAVEVVELRLAQKALMCMSCR
jgi:hypothetical protein